MLSHDAETRRATILCTVGAQTSAGPKEWELVQMLSFDETGERLTRLDEFFDSKFYLEMVAQIHEKGERVEERKEREGEGR